MSFDWGRSVSREWKFGGIKRQAIPRVEGTLSAETIRVGELNQSLSEVKAIPSALLESILHLFVTSRIFAPLLDRSGLIISDTSFPVESFPPPLK